MRNLPSVHRSLVYKMRPERISVLSESLPSLSSLYDDDCDARDDNHDNNKYDDHDDD